MAARPLARPRAARTLALALLALALRAPPVEGGVVTELRPNAPLRGETVPIGGPARQYALLDLDPRRGYEVKLSYPASNPATVHLELIHDPTAHPRTPPRRALRNVEKLPVPARPPRRRPPPANDADPADPDPDPPPPTRAVAVRAVPYAVHRDGPGAAQHAVLAYDIALEPTLDPWGLVPAQAVPVAALAAACAAMAVALEPRVSAVAWPRKTQTQEKSA